MRAVCASSLCSCTATSGARLPARASSGPLWRVSSAATSATRPSTSTARGERSSRLPIGVATTQRQAFSLIVFSEVVHQPTRVRPQGDRSAVIVPPFCHDRATTTVHRMRILLRGAGLLTLGLALAACATVTRLTPEQTAAADRAEQLYRVGEFERAANEFMALARDRGEIGRAHV